MATDSLGTLTVDLIANTGGFERGMDRAERTIKGQQKALEGLRKEFDPTLAAYDRLEKKQEQLNRLFKSGSGVIDKAEYENLSKAINDARIAIDAGGASLNKYGQTAKQTQAAIRGLPAQLTDVATQLAGGANPLLVLLQQGGQIKDQFGGIGNVLAALENGIDSLFGIRAIEEVTKDSKSLNEALSDNVEQAKNIKEGLDGVKSSVGGTSWSAGAIVGATALTAAIGAVVYAYYDAYKTQQEFNQALYQGNGTIGVSAEQLQNLAKQAGLATGNLSGAEDAFKALAASGNFSTTQLENFGEAAAAISQYSGKSAGEVAKSFTQLGDNATEAAQKISQQYGLITAEQYEVIKSIDEQGDSQRALDQLSEDLNNNALERLKTYRSSLTEVERDWDDIKSAISRAYAEVKAEIFPDAARQAEIIQRQIDYINAHPVLSAFTYAGGGSRDEVLQKLEGEKKALQDAGKQTELNAQSQAELTKASQDYIRVSESVDNQLDSTNPAAKRAKAIKDLTKEYLTGYKAAERLISEGKLNELPDWLKGVNVEGDTVSGGSFDKLVAGINQRIKDPKTPKAKTYREDAGIKMLDTLRQQYSAIEAQNLALDNQDKTAQKLGTQAQALAKWEAELAQIKEKKTLTTDQKALLASSDLITAQLKRNAALEKEVALRKQTLDDARKLSAFQSTLNDQIDQARRSQQQNISSFGLGDKEARRLQEVQSIQESYLRQQSQLTKQFNAGQLSPDLYKKETEAVKAAMDERIKIQKDGYAQMDEAQQDWGKGVEASLQNYVDNASNYYQQAADAANTILNGSVKGISDGIYDVITGAESLNDALGNIAATIGQSIIQALAQLAAQWLVLQAVQLAVGQTSATSAVAEAAVAGPAIASAYAPAAAMASLASFGANAAPAIAGISATNIAAQSYALLGMAHDGMDSIPETGTWLLQKGERVTTAETSAKLDKTLSQIQNNQSNSNNRSTVVNYNDYTSGGKGSKNSSARTARRIAQAVDAAQRYE